MRKNIIAVFALAALTTSCIGNKGTTVIHADANGVLTETTEEEAPEAKQYGVDLGLSVNWADCNVGASSPEETGYEIPYGNTSGSLYYDDKTPANISDTSYDIAKVKLGDGWRMPTEEEMRELIVNCNMTTDVVNGVTGVRLTATNGNSIFLPACGSGLNANWDDVEKNRYYKTAEPRTVGQEGGYWTGSESIAGRKQLESMRKMGYEVVERAGSSVLQFSIEKKERNIKAVEPRRNCFPVRPVHE